MNSPKTRKATLPNTGERSSIFVGIGGVLVALIAGLFALRQKRSKKQ
ncbi:LPXTG cell wall anchor domain-containing protein [Streptococcus gallolyticus]|nr:LPXTG cell wall anchor domain-containing protein [Streptococcus gallolyticus]